MTSTARAKFFPFHLLVVSWCFLLSLYLNEWSLTHAGIFVDSICYFVSLVWSLCRTFSARKQRNVKRRRVFNDGKWKSWNMFDFNFQDGKNFCFMDVLGKYLVFRFSNKIKMFKNVNHIPVLVTNISEFLGFSSNETVAYFLAWSHPEVFFRIANV